MSTSPTDSEGNKGLPIDDDRTVIVGASEKATVITPQGKPAPAPPPPMNENIVALPTGTRLSEFEITGLIGEGGFGIVYAAHDHSLERDVAVKEYMPSSLAARTEGYTVSVRAERHADTFQAGLKSFVNEAKLLARFDHPSLVKVYRFWELNGTAYMAMPIYKGVTLKQRLKQMGGPPSEAWLRALLTPLLEALEVIHTENCFHRDIAPDNILLIEDERPVLLDFGAARRVIGDLTHDLTVILKPGYAPAEQYAEVSTMKQGPWTDFYALAAVMYYAITGRPPDPSIGRLMEDQMKPLREVAQGRYSDAFLGAIDAALKVHPDERPRNADEFRALLGQPAPQAQPTRAAQPATPPRPAAAQPGTEAPKPQPRRWGLNAVVAVVAVAFIGGGAYLLQRLMNTSDPKPEAPVAESPTNTASVEPTPPVAPPPEETPKTPEPPAPEPISAQPQPTPPEPEAKPTPEPTPSTPERPPTTASIAPTPETPVPPRFQRREILPPRSAENLPPGVGEEREEIRKLLQKANESFARNEYKESARYADEVLAREPGNVRARRIKMRAVQAERAAFESIKIE